MGFVPKLTVLYFIGISRIQKLFQLKKFEYDRSVVV